MIGPRPNLLGHQAGAHKRLEVAQPILTNADLEKIRSIAELVDGAFRTATLDATWPAAEGAAGLERALERLCARGHRRGAGRHQHPDPVGPGAVGPDRIAIPAALATAAVHHHLIRQGLRMQTGLVVETGEAREVHHFCVLAGYGAEAINPYLAFETLEQLRVQNRSKLDGQGGAEELHQGARQGHAEGDVQDGHLHLPVLLRRADLRRGRPLHRRSSTSTSPAPTPRSKASGLAEIAEETRAPPPRRLRRRADLPRHARCRRRLRLPPARRGARLDAGDRSPTCSTPCAATCRTSTRPSPRAHQRAERAAADPPRPDAAEAGRDAGPARRGRAGRRDRQALLHRRDELRLDQPRGAHHAGHRHEPHRRALEHRRGRRGGRPLRAAAQRRFHALGDQAGGVGPLRRHRRVPGQRRRHPDQDGPGRQARRGRPAARPQGRREHRPRAPLDAGRRPDLAAAAPRHLFDRGSGPADPRPEERQPAGAHLGEAGLARSGVGTSPPASPRRAPTT